jgi:hypothetical protein
MGNLKFLSSRLHKRKAWLEFFASVVILPMAVLGVGFLLFRPGGIFKFFGLLGLLGLLLFFAYLLNPDSVRDAAHALPDSIRDALNTFYSKRKHYLRVLGLVLLLFFAARFGISGWNTWRADNSARAACGDLQKVQRNLPSTFEFGTDYTHPEDYSKLSSALFSASSHALDAMNADKRHYEYLMREVLLLEINLDGSAQEPDIHSPSNLLELDLLPFCDPNGHIPESIINQYP